MVCMTLYQNRLLCKSNQPRPTAHFHMIYTKPNLICIYEKSGLMLSFPLAACPITSYLQLLYGREQNSGVLTKNRPSRSESGVGGVSRVSRGVFIIIWVARSNTTFNSSRETQIFCSRRLFIGKYE